MSGGSYDYLCFKMEDAAHRLMSKSQQPYRQAFGELMMRCAKAMHFIEWVDSGDNKEGDDLEAIMKCISDKDVLRVTVQEAEKIKQELQRLIAEAKRLNE